MQAAEEEFRYEEPQILIGTTHLAERPVTRNIELTVNYDPCIKPSSFFLGHGEYLVFDACSLSKPSTSRTTNDAKEDRTWF